LGPFSGGQLTIIIVTFAVLLLFPIGAWAVSGSSVFVTDANSGAHAAVVGGSDALTVAEASPKNFFTRSLAPEGSSGFLPLVKSPAGKALIVTSVYVNLIAVTTTGNGHWLSITVSSKNNTCSSVVENALPDIEFNPTAGSGQATIPLQPGIVVPSGRALCVWNHDFPNIDVEVFAFGYVVPASAAVSNPAVTIGGARSEVDPNAKR
jgi:hypothetical protein